MKRHIKSPFLSGSGSGLCGSAFRPRYSMMAWRATHEQETSLFAATRWSSVASFSVRLTERRRLLVAIDTPNPPLSTLFHIDQSLLRQAAAPCSTLRLARLGNCLVRDMFPTEKRVNARVTCENRRANHG